MLVKDPHLHTGQREPDAPRPCSSRSVRRDQSHGLGQAVSLQHFAAKLLREGPGQLLRAGSRPRDHHPERGGIVRAPAIEGDKHRHHGRHQRRHFHPVPLHAAQKEARVEPAEEDAPGRPTRQSARQTRHHPVGVGERENPESHRLVPPGYLTKELGAPLRCGQEVSVGDHDPLRPPGSPGRIHKHGEIVLFPGKDLPVRIGLEEGGEALTPPTGAALRHDNSGWAPLQGLFRPVQKVHGRHEEGRLRISHHPLQLPGGEKEEGRDHHQPLPEHGGVNLGHQGGVGKHHHNPVPGPEPELPEGTRQSRRSLLELRGRMELLGAIRSDVHEATVAPLLQPPLKHSRDVQRPPFLDPGLQVFCVLDCT